MCTSLRGWVATMLSTWDLYCFTLKVIHWWHFLTCSFACTAILGQRDGHALGQAFFQGLSGLSHYGIFAEWYLCAWLAIPAETMPHGTFLAELFCNAPPQFEVVAFSQELPELLWAGWLVLLQTQGPILCPHNHLTQDEVCQLSLLPVFGSHAGHLWTIPYWVQDMQVPVVCLNGSHRAIKGSLVYGSHCHYSDLVVCAWGVQPFTQAKDTLNKASTPILAFPAL